MIGLLVFAATAAAAAPPPGEEAVAPYVQRDANAGSTPIRSDALIRAFHGREGVGRIVDELIDRSVADPAIRDIFEGHDLVRLRRTLKEQICYLVGGGCTYTGRDMKTVHKDLGIQAKDMNVLVVHLQQAMSREGVPFFAQNRLLAELAPMRPDVVER